MKKKEKITVVILAAIVVVYYIIYFGILVTQVSGIFTILGIIPLFLIYMMVNKAKERLEEIEGGEEDDLSQY